MTPPQIPAMSAVRSRSDDAPASRPRGVNLPQLEGYQVLSPLGAGGMGTVWRARQLSTRREVALKLLPLSAAASERARLRFEREVEVTARLRHPNLARVYDSGVHQGVCYFAMELVDGVPLDQHVRRARLSRRDALRVMAVVCRAVEHAHLSGVIHRDLKPSNVLVTEDGRPHVVDFGLGTLLPAEAGGGAAGGANALTLDGECAGTPAYMSPEQAAGGPDRLDTRTDVYSLGVMLFDLVTGRLPHDPAGPYPSLLRRIAEDEVPRPRSLDRTVDRDLEALLLRALARRREDRYPTAGDLARDIENYLSGEPLAARRPTATYFLGKKLRKHRVPLAGVAAALAAVVALSAYWSVQVTRQRDRATAAAAAEREQRQVAELRLADGKVGWADALAAEGKWDDARRHYWEAHDLQRSHDVPPLVAGLGLLDAYRAAPRPLAEVRADPRTSVAALEGADGRELTLTGADGGRRRVDMAAPFAAATAAPVAGREPASTPALPGRAASPRGPWRGPGRVVFTRDASTDPDDSARELVIADLAPTGDAYVDVTMNRVDNGTVNAWLSADGRTLAASDGAGTASIWDLTAGPREAAARGPVWRGALDRDVTGLGAPALAASRDRTRLLVGGGNGRVAIVEVAGGGPAGRALPFDVGGAAAVTRLEFSPDERYAIAGDAGGTVRVWDVAGRTLRHAFPAHAGAVVALDTSPDGHVLCTGGGDGFVRAWPLGDAPGGRVVAQRPGLQVYAVTLSRDGRLAALGDSRRFVDVLDVATSKLVRRYRMDSPAHALRFSPDGSRLIMAHVEGGVSVLEVRTGRLLSDFNVPLPPRAQLPPPIHARPNRGDVAFSADGSLAIHYGIRGAAAWDVRTGQQVRPLDDNPVTVACVSADGGAALTVRTQASELHVTPFGLNAAGIRRAGVVSLGRDEGLATVLCTSPDGRVFYVGDMKGQLRAYDLDDKRWLWATPAHPSAVRAVTITPDGRWLMTGGADGVVAAWDAVNGRRCRTVAKGEKPVWSVAFGAGGDVILATVGDEATVRAWDVRIAQRLRGLSPFRPGEAADDAQVQLARVEATLLYGADAWAGQLASAASADLAAAGQPSWTAARAAWLGGDGAAAARQFDRLAAAAPSDPALRAYLELCSDAARQGVPDEGVAPRALAAATPSLPVPAQGGLR